MAYSLEELGFLHAHSGQISELAQRIDVPTAEPLSAASAFRNAFGSFGRAALELALARSSAKLPDPTWLADHDSTQQATPLAVAQFRARELAAAFPGATVHDVTCSIGTEGWALQREGLEYIGSDLDPVRCRMAGHNLPEAPIMQADALHPALRAGAADIVLADPARRARGRRITHPEVLLPPLPQLTQAYEGARLVVKCAPGLDYSDWKGSVEVLSVDGGVKEVTLWSATLHRPWKRRATLLRGGRVWDQVDDSLDDSTVDAGPIGKYIVEPDGAVVRAGLVRHYAAREGLWMLDPRIAHLTGDDVPSLSSAFPVLEVVGLKQVARAVAAHDFGSVEILVRGVDVQPDRLRKAWKLKGSQPGAVVISRIGSKAVAVICGPRQWGSAH